MAAPGERDGGDVEGSPLVQGLVDPLAPAEPEPDTSAILTLPNIITVVRLCCLPAGWMLAALGTTDFVDGYIARHFHQVSELGKVLDPVADRLLFFVGVGGIVIDGSCPVWLAVVVLVREVLVTGATLGLAAAGAKRIDVTWYGKAGTFALMIAFPFFLAANSTLGWGKAFGDVLAWGFAIPGLVLSYIALVLYVPLGLKALQEGRAARGPVPAP